MTDPSNTNDTIPFDLTAGLPSIPVSNPACNDKLDVIDQVFSMTRFNHYFWESGEDVMKPHLNPKNVGKPLVLHIDDDVDLVDALTVRLNSAGYRTACALDGVSGVKTALLNPSSVIILDYDMPNGRGDTVIELLKNNDRTKNIPIIVLTAVHKRGLRREMLLKGADEFMTKPFEFDVLKDVIEELIQSRGQE